jgi:phenylpyruvate tautomerase PptA (4-oxalocrotonate tautomerase family)
MKNIEDLVPNIDENIAKLLLKILDFKEEKIAVIFSEIEPLISLY